MEGRTGEAVRGRRSGQAVANGGKGKVKRRNFSQGKKTEVEEVVVSEQRR